MREFTWAPFWLTVILGAIGHGFYSQFIRETSDLEMVFWCFVDAVAGVALTFAWYHYRQSRSTDTHER